MPETFGGEKMGRLPLDHEHPQFLQHFSASLHDSVEELRDWLIRIFQMMEQGKTGEAQRQLVLSLFARWCEGSGIVPFATAEKELQKAAGDRPDAQHLATVLSQQLGLCDRAKAREYASQLLSALRAEDKTDFQKQLWSLYEPFINRYATQTAHVLAARLMLYRVGEDKGLFDRQISHDALQRLLHEQPQPFVATPTPVLDRLEQIRQVCEMLLPAVYRQGQFDWWFVPPLKKQVMNERERRQLTALEREGDIIFRRFLRALDAYDFSQMDVDAWKDVYQHYLPSDERQRLGGFYTPDPLVRLILDLVGYQPETEGLCQRTLLDPACGSGTFLVEATQRLLNHLDQPMPCHKDIDQERAPWIRAQRKLHRIQQTICGVDIHPFATFLTTVNLFFQLLSLYEPAKRKNPNLALALTIAAHDALEKQVPNALDFGEVEVNARIQLAEEYRRRYGELMQRKFDFVVGNPPWGGVLKGELSPLFDPQKRARYQRLYPKAMTGKVDIYVLFLQRGMEWLKEGGRLGMVTQNSYFDRDFGRGIRHYFANHVTLTHLIDLQPFGQVFFKAMNTPAITVAMKGIDNGTEVIIVKTDKPRSYPSQDLNERQRWVIEQMRKVLNNQPTDQNFIAQHFSLPQVQLRRWAGQRWVLDPKHSLRQTFLSLPRRSPDKVWQAKELLLFAQGVTPGGVLELFELDEERWRRLSLEPTLLFKALKGTDVQRWQIRWGGKWMLFPYAHFGKGKRAAFHPAFHLPPKERPKPDLTDALDFTKAVDLYEERVMQTVFDDTERRKRLLNNRIALGLVRFPNTARYLTEYYERLAGRVFEGRFIVEHGRLWYEYWSRRDANIMLAHPKIVLPRLTREPRFALDHKGFLPQDACVALIPLDDNNAFTQFRAALMQMMGRSLSLEEVLLYLLAFLNSPVSGFLLRTGRGKTPKGSYAVTEDYLSEIPIALPLTADDGTAIINAVRTLVDEGTDPETRAAIETDLFQRVLTSLGLSRRQQIALAKDPLPDLKGDEA